MSFNGSGTFLINTAGQPVVSGTVISSTAFNALTADLATGLSTAITKDGQTTVTANIPMSTYKFTGLGVGSAATDSANLSQVQSTVTKLLNSVSGADTITATASPTLAAYAAGQMFYFVAAGDNTTSVTLNIDALGAKAVTRDGSVALAAADIKSGEVIVVVYDGTRFQVVSQLNSAGDARFANVSIASSLYVGGVSTFVGNAGFSANVSIASALSVGGVAAITGATTIGGNLTLSGGTANGVLYLNGSKVATSGSALVFDGTNLGIGTTSPSSFYSGGRQLVVGSGSSGQGISIYTGTANEGGIYFADGTTGNDTVRGQVVYNHSTNALYFATDAAERARIDSSGNLGIGTASPAQKLHISGGTSVALRISATGNAASGLQMGFAGSAVDTFLSNTEAGNLIFGTSNTERARIDSSGNLGIGTASPTYKMAVESTGQILLSLNSTNANGGYMALLKSGLATGYFGAANPLTSGSSTDLAVRAENALVFAAGGGTERARLTSGGDLLVGTTSTIGGGGERFHVSGKLVASNEYCILAGAGTSTGIAYAMRMYSTTASAIVGSITFDGSSTAYNTSSDYRLKDNPQPLTNSGAFIDALQPKTWDWKTDGSRGVGFIAHEVQAVSPGSVVGEKDAVDADGKPAMQAMEYGSAEFIANIVAELQSLRKRVAELESK